MQSWIQQLGAIVLLLGNLISQLPTVNTSAAQTLVATSTVNAVVSSTPDKLDLWLDKLIQLESNGKEDIKHLDVNGRYSYSCLQFQMGTFKGFYPLISSTTPQNAAGWEKAIMSCPTQKRIARAMLEANPGAWRHWYTSVAKRGLGLPPK